VAGENAILMGDGTTRSLPTSALATSSTDRPNVASTGGTPRTPVLAHWQTLKKAFRVTLEDGTALVASGDHRFLTERGWKYRHRTTSGRAGART